MRGGQHRLQKTYGRLLRLTRAVTLQACEVLARLSSGELSARPAAELRALRQENRLRHYLPLVERVIVQTQARVFQAQRHYPEKVLSLFEPHSVVIRKARLINPTNLDVWCGLMRSKTASSAGMRWLPAIEPTSNSGRQDLKKGSGLES